MMKVSALLLGLISMNFAYADNQILSQNITKKDLADVVVEISASTFQSSDLDALVKNSIHENELRFVHIG